MLPLPHLNILCLAYRWTLNRNTIDATEDSYRATTRDKNVGSYINVNISVWEEANRPYSDNIQPCSSKKEREALNATEVNAAPSLEELHLLLAPTGS